MNIISRLKFKKVHGIALVSCCIVMIVVIQSFEWKDEEIKSFLLSSSPPISGNGSVIAPHIDDDLSEQVAMRRFPYATDPVCQNFSLSIFEEDTFPLTALVSFPGSGNTWTRHLIQLATGAYTGSYYFDIELYAGGFLGEKEVWHSGKTIVQKFHEKYSKNMHLEKAILLMREPFPAILSFGNYLEGGHTKSAYRLPYHHKDWPGFLLHSAYNWLSLAKSWIESPVNLLVIHYEDLRLQPVANVEKMCKFLNHSCPHLGSPCFKEKLEGSFRRKQMDTLKDVTRLNKYPTSIQGVINGGIDHLNQLLVQNDLQPIPFHLYEYYSKSSHNDVDSLKTA